MFVDTVMEADMLHAQFAMVIEGVMAICQMEKFAICVMEVQWYDVWYAMELGK